MMARWYGYKIDETRKLLMTDVARFEEFTVMHPPAELILAARYGVARTNNKPLTIDEAAKKNKLAMAMIPKEFGRHTSESAMPEYIRNNPTLKEQRAKMREAMRGS